MTIGKFFVVATPIGNQQDMTYRAVQVLDQADLILAEDTRRTGQLLSHYEIKTPMQSYHAFNEAKKIDTVLQLLAQGQQIALVSDAGTPLISDPGQRLVRALHDAQMSVEAIPGPCAAIAALSVSGLSTEDFRFLGFLPSTAASRRQLLQNLCEYPKTMVFYEAPHRMLATLQVLCDVMGETREVTIAKELTKTYQAVHLSTLRQSMLWLTDDPKRCQGEFVIVLSGCPSSEQTTELETLLQELLRELPLKQAVSIASRVTGVRRNEVYQQALALTKTESQ